MNEVKFPDGYQQVIPYLIVKDAPAFSTFMQQVFGAEETLRKMRDDTAIMHAEVKVGDCTIMFADSTDQYEPMNASLFIYVADADATCEKAIAAGATSLGEVTDQGYGRSGGIRDPFGNVWWVTSVK